MLRYWRNALAAIVVVGLAPSPGKAQPPVGNQPFNWSGFYVGGFVGGGAGDVPWSDREGFLGKARTSGLIFGGDGGYNLQSGSFVAGVEVSGGFSTIQADFSARGWVFGGALRSFESVTGHVGFAAGADGSSLLSVKGGAVRAQYNLFSDWREIGTRFDANPTLTGWAVGLGYEQAIAPNITIKLNYTRYEFGSRTEQLMPNNPRAPYQADIGNWGINKVTMGANYRLGDPWGAVSRVRRDFRVDRD